MSKNRKKRTYTSENKPSCSKDGFSEFPGGNENRVLKKPSDCNTEIPIPLVDKPVTRLQKQGKKSNTVSLSKNCKSQPTITKQLKIEGNEIKNNKKTKNYKDDLESEETVTSVGLDKITYDIKIDPNVADVYTNKPILVMPEIVMPDVVMSEPESQEAEMIRIETKNLVQCHSRTRNKKDNQGPVINPPLISPARFVGYTPGGQRHEVDLNLDRPTLFNSEYARMYFDSSAVNNATSAVHKLETGMFLPSTLDPDIERRFFAEQSLVTEDARQYFENCINNLPQTSQSQDEHMSLLESERQLIDLTHFAAVKFQDFPSELINRLNSALTLKLAPLMFKKNPIIVSTLEKLCKHCKNRDVVMLAQALLDKIKGVFPVPKTQSFQEYSATEVQGLREKTKNMSPFEILMLTKEPRNDFNGEISSEIRNTETVETNPLENSNIPSQETAHSNENAEWVPVGNGDIWEDLSASEDEESYCTCSSTEYTTFSGSDLLSAAEDDFSTDENEYDSEDNLLVDSTAYEE